MKQLEQNDESTAIHRKKCAVRRGAIGAVCLLVGLLSSTACEKKVKGPVGPTAAKGAVPELGAALQRIAAAVVARNAAAIRAEIDAELGLRVDATFRHAAARSVDQLAISQKAGAQVREAQSQQLKREEIAEILTRGLGKEKLCAFAGEVLMRTPRWPTKKREGWDLILENGTLIQHVYDAYVPCKSGFSLEIRFAQRKGGAEWKAVAASELPFGVQKPPPPPMAVWD